MKIGIKLRCYPDSQLKQLIHQTAGNHRFIYNYYYNQNSSSKSQAELKNINNKEKKLPESGGEVKTVEMYKTNNIPSNIIGNINEAVNGNIH